MSKVAVIGIGGVGGYLAGALANVYDQVSFVARGKRKDALEKNGLILRSYYQGNITVHPKCVVEDIRELEVQDYIFVCVKNYSLETVCEGLREAVGEHTVIIPVMNGVDPGEHTRSLVGKGIVLDSFIYIVAHTNPDYSVDQNGKIAHIHIGRNNPSEQESKAIQNVAELLKKAKVDCRIEEDIQQAIWRKYSLNCAFNVLTAYYSCDTDGIRKDEKRLEEYRTLLQEAHKVAAAKGVCFEAGFPETQLMHFMRQPGDATSSLCRDMREGKTSELETFSGYLVREAKRLRVEVPMSEYFYQKLSAM